MALPFAGQASWSPALRLRPLGQQYAACPVLRSRNAPPRLVHGIVSYSVASRPSQRGHMGTAGAAHPACGGPRIQIASCHQPDSPHPRQRPGRAGRAGGMGRQVGDSAKSHRQKKIVAQNQMAGIPSKKNAQVRSLEQCCNARMSIDSNGTAAEIRMWVGHHSFSEV